MNKQRKTRNPKGITLIALIITIVVLLILAVVAIRAVQGDGILSYAKNARDDYQAAQNEEQTQLQNYLNILNENNPSNNSSSEETLAPGLYAEDGTIAYTWQQLLDEGYFYNDNGTLYCCLDNCVREYNDDGAVSMPYETKNNNINLPENSKLVIDNSITTIGHGCSVDSNYYSQITSIIIPNTTTSIEEFAFTYDDSLTSITIPNSVKSFNGYIIFGCNNLRIINYIGTIEEFNNIKYGEYSDNWYYDTNEITVHCTDGDIIIDANA